jgi:hypothetical protein
MNQVERETLLTPSVLQKCTLTAVSGARKGMSEITYLGTCTQQHPPLPGEFLRSLTVKADEDLLSIESFVTRGAILFTQGESSSHLHLIMDGQVRLSNYSSSGRKLILRNARRVGRLHWLFTRIMNEMQRKGVLELRGSLLTVLDLIGLEEQATG